MLSSASHLRLFRVCTYGMPVRDIFVTGTKRRLSWLMPMDALDQVRVKDECDDYELSHSASACVH